MIVRPTFLLRAGAVALAASLLASAPVQARDTRLKLKIEDAMQEYSGKLDSGIKLYWGDASYPKSAKGMGTFTSNKKTNFFNKSDEEGCKWAWLSAVLELQERAKKEGGNAVVEIKSVYRKDELKSQTEYECGAGAVMGGVALQGTVVKLP